MPFYRVLNSFGSNATHGSDGAVKADSIDVLPDGTLVFKVGGIIRLAVAAGQWISVGECTGNLVLAMAEIVSWDTSKGSAA